jgi:hypothetical protein
MGHTPYVQRPAGSLKEATSALVTAVGGQARAADLVGSTQSVVQRYTDPSAPDRSIPVAKVRILEAAARRPIITEFLAAEAGCLLLQPLLDIAGSPNADFATIGQEIGDLFATIHRAQSDGRIDPREAGQVINALDDAARAIMAARATMRLMAGDDA